MDMAGTHHGCAGTQILHIKREVLSTIRYIAYFEASVQYHSLQLGIGGHFLPTLIRFKKNLSVLSSFL